MPGWSILLGVPACVSGVLTLWQWFEGRRFPLHRRPSNEPFAPGITLLKPMKGADAETESCLRSWLGQEYRGPMQFLFGVASADDPACAVVRALAAEFPQREVRLVVCTERLGVSAKVSKLAKLALQMQHDFVLVSDADVWVPPGLVADLVAAFRRPEVALVNPFYRLANPVNLAMHWEAVAVNSDFWTNVLMSRRLGPMRFALGAVMAVRRAELEAMGGFGALVNHLADDYELGRRIAHRGGTIAICPTVVDCREAPQGFGNVWRHQLRWSRTIRVCQPGPYAASLISNATLWPALWFLACPGRVSALALTVCVLVRLLTAVDNQHRLTRSWSHWPWFWLAPVKDLLQVVLWSLAFLGNTVEWRGERYRVNRHGELVRCGG